MKRIVIAILSCFSMLTLSAQTDPVLLYIETYKGLAMEEMKRTGVPASIKLAQGILESEVGESPLARNANNHFGIKCKSNWTGESMYHDDDERGECFRKYDNPAQSYRDHSDFLKNSNRYGQLFELDPSDYKGWSHGLKRAGYATNPHYPQRLIRNIEKYDLQQYTLLVLEESGSGLPSGYGNSSDAGSGADASVSRETRAASLQPKGEYGKKAAFNGLKAVYVSRGTSLLALSNRLHLPLSRVMEYNDLESDGLLESDQWIYLEKKRKEGHTDYYEAAEGETLHAISQVTGIQLSQLMLFNPDLRDQIMPSPGTRIYLKQGKHTPRSTVMKEKALIHEVKPKEGLYSIARMYNVSVDEIKVLNNLRDENLRIGQQLIISN